MTGALEICMDTQTDLHFCCWPHGGISNEQFGICFMEGKLTKIIPQLSSYMLHVFSSVYTFSSLYCNIHSVLGPFLL